MTGSEADNEGGRRDLCCDSDRAAHWQMVVRQGMSLVLIETMFGVDAAGAVARSLESLLFGR